MNSFGRQLFQLPSWKKRESSWQEAAACNLPFWLFPIYFLGKPAKKIANDIHTIVGYLATNCECEQVAKHSDCDDVTMCVCVGELGQHFAIVMNHQGYYNSTLLLKEWL